jgi:hypothetical protein
MKALSESLNAMVGSMPPTIRTIWSVFALLMAIAVLVAVLHERRRYAARNKAGAWLFVRLATLPIGMATAAAVVIPARAIGGPEALAAFYLLAVTAGPLVYFGLHWFAGFFVGLARKDALAIGLTGLFMVLGPILLANQAQRWVFELARAIDGTGAVHGSKFPPGEKNRRCIRWSSNSVLLCLRLAKSGPSAGTLPTAYVSSVSNSKCVANMLR